MIRLGGPGWLWPLAAVVLCGLAVEVFFATEYQGKQRELDRLEARASAASAHLLETRAAAERLTAFRAEVHALDADLAKLARSLPAPIDAGEETRWLKKAIADAGFTEPALLVAEPTEAGSSVRRRSEFKIRATTQDLEALLTLLETRPPVHRIVGLTEWRSASGPALYRILVEVDMER